MGFDFVPRLPCQTVQMPAKTANGRSSFSEDQVGVLRGLVSAYSQNDVNGTTHRFSGFSQARQCGLFTLRMLVIGAPPKAGGPGMPHRAKASSRTPSGALRAIGARKSGKIPGIDGRFPVRSRIARTSAMIAACPLVKEYTLHINQPTLR